MKRPHGHDCQGKDCIVSVECSGELELNPDGFPRVICPEFHRPGGTINPDWLCEACSEKAEADAQTEAF